MVKPHQVVGIAVDSDFAADLLAPRVPGLAAEFGRAVDAAGVDFLLVGSDRGRGVTADRVVDSTVAATVLARLTERTGIVVTATFGREHPFNVARRLASLDHGSHGRAGLPVAPGAAVDTVWTEADPVDAAADAVAAARALWGSWPADTIVADRERGVYTESDRITFVDHDGAYRVSGPLNVPEPPQVNLPIFWAPRGDGEASVARSVADVVVLEDETAVADHGRLDARAQAVLVESHWTPGAQIPLPTAADGIVLRGVTVHTWPEVLTAVSRRPVDGHRTLRDRFGLTTPEHIHRGTRSLFPAV